MIRRSDILLLDVGGTFIKCSDGRCIPMPSGGSREQIAHALRAAVSRPDGTGPREAESFTPSGECFPQPGTTPQPAPRRIGVAIPGPFEYADGVFLMRHKFAAVYGESFRTLAGLPEDTELRYMHDVVAALEGALSDPAGLVRETALVTIGTGLGFAHTQGGRVQVGPTGSPARSIYNLPCGGGILEDAVSARGLRTAYVRLGGRTDLSAAQIAQTAFGGDERAMQAFSEMGGTLGDVLAPLLEELSVGILLLAGQVSRSLSLFERPLRNALDGIDVRLAPEGAVFRGLAARWDTPDGFDTTQR